MTATVTVSDPSGQNLPDTSVTVTGPTEHEGRTAANGTVHFAGLRAGDYRVRLEHEGYVTLEREITIKSGQPARVEVALSAAPPPAPPPPAPKPVATSGPDHAPLPQADFDITAYLEKNYLTSGAQRVKSIACSPTDSVELVQTNDAYALAASADKQFVIVTIAGRGHVTAGGRTMSLDARSGTTVTIPKEVGFEATREGNRPLVFVLVRMGQGCEEAGQ
jgi:mannose-6-phosphate isomerase-like protein (cupin superfamily)